MGLLSILTGIVTLLLMIVAFLPLIGWLNWFNIPIALAGLALGVAARSGPRGSRLGNIGIIFCSTAVTVGMLRLFIGCGII